MSERKYLLIRSNLDYKVMKLDRKALIITEGYHDIAVMGNTYPIKEHLKALGFTWSRKNRWWYKFCDHYREEAPKLAEQLSQITDAPIYIVATLLDTWDGHIIDREEELIEILKRRKKNRKGVEP